MPKPFITSENTTFFESIENHLASLNLEELTWLQTLVQNHHDKASADLPETASHGAPENIDQTLSLTFGDVDVAEMDAIKQKIHKTL